VVLLSEHAIADREDVILLGAGFFAAVRRGDAIGQMPGSELIRMARACGEPQLEPALGLARQIQDHDAVGGAKFERHRPSDDAVTVVIRPQRTLHLGQRLVVVGVQFDLAIGHLRRSDLGRRISNSIAGFDGLMPR